jgi:histidine kinase
MSAVDRYEILERLHDGRAVAVFRARDRELGDLVILKVSKPTSGAAERLRHEHRILTSLTGLPGVARARGLERDGRDVALVLEDRGGETLKARLARGPMPLADVLRVSAELADTLGHIHHRRVIHKDINPANILLLEGRRPVIFDFDIATSVPLEVQAESALGSLAGTLAYLSPEQTGRMNRAVDSRADLYSLGVTLYEMLTGGVPFASSDPLEIVHSHIAKLPRDPSEVSPRVPEPASAIVMRLLAKTPEARYQSAFGVAADLDECRRRLASSGRVEPFPLGQSDLSDRFQLTQRLYGREIEVAALEAAFARVKAGGPAELLVVTGGSGVGKSSLIREMYRPLTATRGRFVAGKFEQLERDIPWSALLRALDELVKGLLAEPDARLAEVRAHIQEALGDCGRALTSLLPSLEHVLGPQPQLQEVPAREARHRFRHIFKRFLGVFTRQGQPLVIFLDDLQWADAATLDLLASILAGADLSALLVIGAYRDTDVDDGHPLDDALAAIKEASGRVTRIALAPLSEEHVERIVADSLAMTTEEARPLADLVRRRTLGNPLFIGELLTMLHLRGLIAFDQQTRGFRFDLAGIERAEGTDNIGQLMTTRAAALGQATREALALVAVLGSRFDLETLASAACCAEEETAALLEEALREGLLLVTETATTTGYRFVHDRVQQAAYAGIPEDARLALHHRVGEMLLAKRPEGEHDDWLFAVLHHLNFAAARVETPARRRELACLNLAAATRARASGAFGAAASHYAAGARFLPDDALRRDHDLAFTLHIGHAECAYLLGEEATAEQIFARLDAEATTALERARVSEAMGSYSARVGRLREAITLSLEALRRLGVDLAPNPGVHRVIIDAIQTRGAIGSRTHEDLRRLPETTDPTTLAQLRLLNIVSSASFFVDPHLFARSNLTMARLTLAHGNSSFAALGYSLCGMLLTGAMRDYASGEAYGKLALELTELHPNKNVEAQVHTIYGGVLAGFCIPLEAALQHLEEAWRRGLVSGNLTFAGYGLGAAATLLCQTGRTIDEIRQKCAAFLASVRGTNLRAVEQQIAMVEHSMRALKGTTRAVGSFSTDDFDEDRFAAEAERHDAGIYLYMYRGSKAAVLYLLERYDEALAFAEAARRDPDDAFLTIPGSVNQVFFDALLRAAVVDRAGPLTRRRELATIRSHLRRLDACAASAAMNFAHKRALVAAELARVTLDDHAAIGRYEEATRLAREGGFLGDEALALELTSRFYRARGAADVALVYLERARQTYVRWGADAKVALIDGAYPGIDAHAVTGASFTSSATTATPTSGALDAPSMIKASQALSGEVSLDKLLLRLMNVIAENAGAERGALVIVTDGTPTLVAEFSAAKGASLPERPLPLDGGAAVTPAIIHYVLRTRERILLRDARRDGPFTSDAHVIEHAPRAVLCAPLLRKGEISGAVYLENNLVPGAFNEERAALLSVLCAQMAISIDNANLYADLERKVRERTRALEKAQARLVQLERDTTEAQMAGGFAHEMRNALSGARLMLAKVYRKRGAGADWSQCAENSEGMKELFLRLRQDLPDDSLRDVSRVLKRINDGEAQLDMVLRGVDQSLERGLGITSLLLEYAQIGRARPGSGTVHIGPLVNLVLEDLGDEMSAQGIAVEVDIPEACIFSGDERHYHSILKNLVLNARDALLEREGSAARRIRLHVVEEPTRKVLTVSDTGAGIPVEVRARIFEPFFSTKPRTGTGLGLGMVKKLAALYGGQIEFDSELGHGTTFRIILPGTEAQGRG